MNEKQLSKAEIQQIFQFMKKNGVNYYDVQLEMVDHFASEIEENWEDYPARFSFENKVLDVYSRIGQRGFDKIIQTKSRALNKWFWKYCFDYIRSFFSWPKILITTLLMGLFYMAIMQSNDPVKFGYKILYIGIVLPFFFFITSLHLKVLFKDKVKILSLNYIYLMWILMGVNNVYLFTSICEMTTLDQQVIMPYILTIFFAFCVYFFTASALAFYKCYIDFKLQYPKLT